MEYKGENETGSVVSLFKVTPKKRREEEEEEERRKRLKARKRLGFSGVSALIGFLGGLQRKLYFQQSLPSSYPS